jgi:hypothetical protein
LVTRYQRERRPDEPFYLWARRTPNPELLTTVAGPAEAVVR